MSKKNIVIMAIIGILAAALLIAIGFIAGVLAQTKTVDTEQNPIPAEQFAKVNFAPLVVPLNSPAITTSNYSVSEAEDGTLILKFDASISDDGVTITQYPQPTQFSDVPDFKQSFLDSVIQQTHTVSTSNGTVYIGKMAKQNNRQIGVMIEHGLLIFMNPAQTLDDTTWRTLGNLFEIAK